MGILALFLVSVFVEDPPYLKAAFRGTIDALGFGLMALWLGTLQLVLDKGQESDWFGADWICWTAAVSVVALVAYLSLPIVHPGAGMPAGVAAAYLLEEHAAESSGNPLADRGLIVQASVVDSQQTLDPGGVGPSSSDK